MLEPYDGKLSRTVLRGAWGRKTLGPTRSGREKTKAELPHVAPSDHTL